MSALRISALDASPVWGEATAASALHDTLELARAAERIGLTRFWLTEHHNTPALACAATAVMVAEVARVTERIRVGSGGVLLPNHAPLAVAEQFGTLAALHPGRIDLGVGRAAGTDATTAGLLRRGAAPPPHDDFPQQLAELAGYFAPSASSADAVVAMPAWEQRPPLWLLGGSPGSARFAGSLGLPYAFAHHMRPDLTAASLGAYREAFRPSEQLDAPYAIVAAIAIAGEDDEHARQIAAPYSLAKLRMRAPHRFRSFPGPQESARQRLDAEQRDYVERWLGTQLAGGPERVRLRLQQLVEETGADELMAFTMVAGQADRIRSFELLADAAGVRGATARAV